MMVNLDNGSSSSVGFGLEDLLHLNNNNNEAEAKTESTSDTIDKVRRYLRNFIRERLRVWFLCYLQNALVSWRHELSNYLKRGELAWIWSI